MEQKKIKLFVTSRKIKQKDSNKSFIAYKVKMKLADKGETTKKVRWIDLKFKDEGDNIKHSNEVKRGYITCLADKVDTPHYFEITKDEKTGKDKYPCVWVHNFLDYEERLIVASQDEFATEEEEVTKTDTSVATSEDESDAFTTDGITLQPM